MKLWILSATILFFRFLVFFARQFPRHNPAFAAGLCESCAAKISASEKVGT